MLKFQLTTRAEFNRLTETKPSTLTDLERAARFLYLQRTAFGGKVKGQAFGVAREQPGHFNLSTLEPMLEDLHARLSGVIIECLSYDAFITRYDGPKTLFYLDPPYWGCETEYGKDVFSRSDFSNLADLLKGIKGAFIMSINDTDDVRNTFADFQIQPVKTTYTIAQNGGGAGRPELLIMGGV